MPVFIADRNAREMSALYDTWAEDDEPDRLETLLLDLAETERELAEAIRRNLGEAA